MEVAITNSINLENIQNIESYRTLKRIFSNSDLELNYSNNDRNINQESEQNNINQENDNEIHNQNNQNGNNNNEDNISNNSSNINNSLNIFDNLFDLVSNNEGNNNENNNIIQNLDLIKELINENSIFIKDYYNQKINDNLLYNKWLKKIYIKLNFPKEESIIEKPLIINKKIDISENNIIRQEIEKKLFFCLNPQCNCIVYMTQEQKEKIKNIKNLFYNENLETIGEYIKDRCPLCLKYKCNFCNKTSTLLNANCCIKQLNYACGSLTFNFCNYHAIFQIALFIPIIRLFYMSCMINFGLFRGLTLENKLLQSEKSILRMIGNGMTSDVIFGTYQSKFKRFPLIIISLLNIFGSILWAIPYIIFLEVILIILMLIGFCTKYQYYKQITNDCYFLAFIPGLRRGITGTLRNE